MLIDLSGVLSEQHRGIDTIAELEMNTFQNGKSVFPILKKEPVHIRVSHLKKRELSVEGETGLTIQIPCDRCLADTPVEFRLKFDRHIDMDDKDAVHAEELDEANYIDGYDLDVDRLLYNEILVGWPMKVLCREDCKGICSVCGQNLNEGTCNCEDTGLDPRMSVIRDLFRNFKEV